MYLGIDPGIGGAWAVIDDKSDIIAYYQGKTMDGEFLLWHPEGRITFAYLENQGLRHSDQGGKQFHIQKLLINFGIWQGIMNALDISFDLIAPLTWLSRWGCAGRMSANERKKSYTEVARKLWPELKWLGKDHDLAAACLLAELARVDYNRIGGNL